jgi:hypothetical protein
MAVSSRKLNYNQPNGLQKKGYFIFPPPPIVEEVGLLILHR